MHGILERLFKKEISPMDALNYFADNFDDTLADFDNEKLKGKKFDAGLLYWQNMADRFDDLIANMEILGVEKRVDFQYKGHKYMGRIDLLFRDKRDGALIVCDHKSAASVIGKKGQVLKSEKKKLDGYVKQMALYSYPIIQEYGEEPKFWLWNFFNDGVVYKRPFSKKEMQDALDWSVETIKAIERDETFAANRQFFYCSKLCDFRESCEERFEDN